MRLLIAAALLGSTLLLAGCSGKPDDGTNNPTAKRLTDAEFAAKRAKKDGSQ